MLSRDDLVAEARSWVGTPFLHQGQLKGRGCDCKGLVVGVAAELQLPEALTIAAGVRNYGIAVRGRDMLSGLEASLIKVEEAQPGDVLAILWGRDPFPRHLAILTAPGWGVHAYGGGVRKVAEVPLGRMRVHSIWTWPSLGGSVGR